MQLIDSHCHLSNLQFRDCPADIIKNSNNHKISYFLQSGYNPIEWMEQLKLYNKYKGVLPVFGLHPEWIAKCTESEVESGLDQLAKLLKHAFAIGGVGLDLREQYLNSFNLQMEACEKQFELAHIANLPLVLHIVRAHNEFLNFLEHFDIPRTGGFIHSFNGSWNTAKQYLDKGLLISISGAVTYEKNMKLRDAVKKIPIESLLIETDCPNQVPIDWGTEIYTPKGIWSVAKYLSEIRSEKTEELLIKSSENLSKLLKLKEKIGTYSKQP